MLRRSLVAALALPTVFDMQYIDAKFEKISKYENDETVNVPVRKTAGSVGYDFCAAE